jgi:hypothetical protein
MYVLTSGPAISAAAIVPSPALFLAMPIPGLNLASAGIRFAATRVVCHGRHGPLPEGRATEATQSEGLKHSSEAFYVKRSPFLAFILLPLIAACGGGGGGSSTPNALPQVTAPLGSQLALGALNEAQSDATQRLAESHKFSHADRLYVGNLGNNSITVYRYDAQGNTRPLKVIAGPKTGLNNPGQLSEDAQGNLYVTNRGTNSVLVFAYGASGNKAPIRILGGPSTGIDRLTAAFVDQITGKLFVSETDANTPLASLLRFPPKATGNTAPFAKGRTIFAAYQLTSDSTNSRLIEAHYPDASSDAELGIDTLAKQFANNTSPIAFYITGWFRTFGVVGDPTTKTYLATMSSLVDPAIYRFAENTVGSGPDSPSGMTFAPAPVAIITSETCGLQLALGYLRSIYVTRTCQNGSVNVYAHDASGNAAPIRVLNGPATGLSQPYGIYVGQ